MKGSAAPERPIERGGRGEARGEAKGRAWRTVRVGDLCDLVNGDPFKPSDWSKTGTRIIRIQNLNDAAKPFNHWSGPVDRLVQVKDGDVLLAWSGTPGTSFGAHIWRRGDGVLNQHIFRVDLTSDEVTPEWFVLAVNFCLQALIKRAHGAVGLAHVTKGEVQALEIPLPPLAEQERIAGCVSRGVERASAARRAALDRLAAAEALPAALLREVFEGPEASGWETVDHACLTIDYGHTASAQATASGPRFLRITDIQDSRVDWATVPGCHIDADDEASLGLADGDIVFARTGATTGKSFLIRNPPRAVFASYLIRLRLDPTVALPDFVYLFFQSDAYWEQLRGFARGAAQPNVNATLLGQIQLPLPDLRTQRRLAAELTKKLAAAEGVIARCREELAAIEALPAALLRQAFGGSEVSDA